MSYAPGTLIRARGREWVVLPDSSDDLLMARPLGGLDQGYALHKWLGVAAGILLSLHWLAENGARWMVEWGWVSSFTATEPSFFNLSENELISFAPLRIKSRQTASFP